MKIFLDANGRSVSLPKDEKISWRISGYALIEDRGKILVVVPTWNTQFELPGGGIEEEEGLKQGILRECYEETGYHVILPDASPFYVGEENFYHRHLHKFYHSLIVVYRVRLRSHRQNLKAINVSDGDEISKISWEELSVFTRKNAHRIIYPAIQRYQGLKNRKFSGSFSV